MNARKLGAQTVQPFQGIRSISLEEDVTIGGSPGLTKRELFAVTFAAPLVGIMKNAEEDVPVLPETAVGLADELLAQLANDWP